MATAMHPDRFWSLVRYNLWRALQADDDAALMGTLSRTARHEHCGVPEVLRTLYARLWRPHPDDPAAVAARGGVLAAAAGNRHGVPVSGALRCVRRLLAVVPHEAAEVARARARCGRFPERREMLALLDTHAARADGWRGTATGGSRGEWAADLFTIAAGRGAADDRSPLIAITADQLGTALRLA